MGSYYECHEDITINEEGGWHKKKVTYEATLMVNEHEKKMLVAMKIEICDKEKE